MRNLKIRVKLISSFSVVLVLAVIVGAIGIIGMLKLDQLASDMYDSNVASLKAISDIQDAFARERVALCNIVIDISDPSAAKTQIDNCNKAVSDLDTLFIAYEKTIIPGTENLEKAYYDAREAHNGDYAAARKDIIKAVDTANEPAAKAALANGAAVAAKINTGLSESKDYNIKLASDSNDNGDKLYKALLMLQIIALVLAAAVVAFFAVYISIIIAQPVRKMATAADALAVGNMNVDVTYKARDEIGQLSDSFSKMIDGIKVQAGYVERLAEGDLTIDPKPRCKDDTMGIALEKMVSNLNSMFSELNSAITQVSSGSDQIAGSAQSLAQGATEQASAVEELSATISEISGHIELNADNSNTAKEESLNSAQAVQLSNSKMASMMSAMDDISDKSGQIGKIIKTIEDIAFQTNILALNAAVEAARAGAAGKGFAVVADEVRNLASKSAAAAKNTTQLIESSISAVGNGTKLADETAEALQDIIKATSVATDLIVEISQSTGEQASSMSQIKIGMDQISAVVQTNSATSEESAASAEELSSQAALLKSLISRFKLKDYAGTADMEYSSYQPSSVSSSDYNYNYGDNSSKY